MAIKVLSEQLASQIAAGEVVERPASAVKELVENAIDAGATTINVDIRNGGRTLIRISDNGRGIDSAEVETAFLRHATSKLKDSASLASISTLGFRGEALAAIASVSKVTVVTRTRADQSGTRIELDGGTLCSRDVVGAPAGTVIAVENLFFNTPARLKFLKSITSEKRAIDEFLTRVSLAYPSVRFRLTHNGRVTFQTNGTGDLRDALLSVYGAEIGRQFIPIGNSAETPTPEPAQATVQISGYVSPPSLHRANRSHISLYVNGRWIKDQRLTYAIVEAYHTFLPSGRYPLAAIFITLPYEDVDVNVHPMKTEVRFHKHGKIFSVVQRSVRETLLETAPVRSIDSPFEQITSTAPWNRPLTGKPKLTDWGAWGEQNELALQRPEPTPPVQTGAEIGVDNPQPEMKLGGERLPIMRVVGQVGRAYIITEGPEGMFLIDQHAAHERILFEQFMQEWSAKTLVSQQLVTGLPVQVTPAQSALLEENLTRLDDIGFAIEAFGPQTFMIRAVPALLVKADPAQALHAMVGDLEDEDKLMQTQVEAAMIKRACKTAAIKAGQVLTNSEMDALVRQLEDCETPHTCPHGRPTLIHLSVAQLANQFGRT
ncbi:MAG: DNA mismatch repair endonuclease MutL [Candidatus Promineifilaceae bacterium]